MFLKRVTHAAIIRSSIQFCKQRIHIIGIYSLIVGLCWFGVHVMLTRSITSYRRGISRYNQKKIGIITTYHEQAELLKKIRALSLHNKRTISELSMCSSSSILKDIFTECIVHNLTIIRFKPGILVRKSWYDKRELSLDCMGSFYDIYHFLSRLASSRLPINLTRLTLEHKNEQIVCSCTIKYYLMSKD